MLFAGGHSLTFQNQDHMILLHFILSHFLLLPIQTEQDAHFSCSLVIEVKTTAVSCPSSRDGHIQVSVLGGCPPYRVYFNNKLTNVEEANTTIEFSRLSPDDYKIEVTDGKDCKKKKVIRIPDDSEPEISYTSIPETCINDGEIKLILPYAESYYTIDWDDANTPSFDRQGLKAGKYFATITDKMGCASTLEIDLPKEQCDSIVSTYVSYPINYPNDVIEQGDDLDLKKGKSIYKQKRKKKKSRRAKKPKRKKLRASRWSRCPSFS